MMAIVIYYNLVARLIVVNIMVNYDHVAMDQYLYIPFLGG